MANKEYLKAEARRLGFTSEYLFTNSLIRVFIFLFIGIPPTGKVWRYSFRKRHGSPPLFSTISPSSCWVWNEKDLPSLMPLESCPPTNGQFKQLLPSANNLSKLLFIHVQEILKIMDSWIPEVGNLEEDDSTFYRSSRPSLAIFLW
ncbi:hypothetical protein ACFE04_015019 [Oxalis oulophora]